MNERKSNEGVKINEGGASKKDTSHDDSILIYHKLMKENEELDRKTKELELRVVNKEMKKKLSFLESTLKDPILETLSPQGHSSSSNPHTSNKGSPTSNPYSPSS